MRENKNYKQYVELIFDYFKGCNIGQGLYLFRTLRAVKQFSQGLQNRLTLTTINLIDCGYLYSDDGTGAFIKLTEKGYAYTQDGELDYASIDLKSVIHCYDDGKVTFQTLWDIIGKDSEAMFYVSGPEFFNVIRNFVETGAATYTDYMMQLKDMGESQSRSIWYRKLFEKIKKEDLDKFLDDLSQVIYDIYSMVDKVSSPDDLEIALGEPDYTTSVQKTVFISYCHDGADFDNWVGQFAADIRAKGINVITDQNMSFGTDINHFMEQSIANSNRVLIIVTKKYKERADGRAGGVGYESCIITGELVNDQNTNKFIPVIKEGQGMQYYPIYLGNRWGANMQDPQQYQSMLEAICTDILNN